MRQSAVLRHADAVRGLEWRHPGNNRPHHCADPWEPVTRAEDASLARRLGVRKPPAATMARAFACAAPRGRSSPRCHFAGEIAAIDPHLTSCVQHHWSPARARKDHPMQLSAIVQTRGRSPCPPASAGASTRPGRWRRFRGDSAGPVRGKGRGSKSCTAHVVSTALGKRAVTAHATAGTVRSESTG